jgi:prepilin-type N-terminal cleavage/methylation domain-containing protein
MKRYRNGAARGFSLVELLAVVLVLAVLAGIAIPLYINTRKSSAARACKANIAAIAAAESTYAVRNGAYTATMATLVSAVEGFAQTPTCPLDGSSYTLTVDATTGALTIKCPNDKATGGHPDVMGAVGDWTKTYNGPAKDTGP